MMAIILFLSGVGAFYFGDSLLVIRNRYRYHRDFGPKFDDWKVPLRCVLTYCRWEQTGFGKYLLRTGEIFSPIYRCSRCKMGRLQSLSGFHYYSPDVLAKKLETAAAVSDGRAVSITKPVKSTPFLFDPNRPPSA